jgi:hypothetical protein
MGHTASFFWQGKDPAAAFYTTVPFGFTPAEHVAWIDSGGGQALWDELYAPFGAKPWQHRGLHGRVVPPRYQQSRRYARAENPFAWSRR